MTPPVISFAPIATQVARLLPLNKLLPSDAVEQSKRSYEAQRARDDRPRLSPDALDFCAHYFALVKAAMGVLMSPSFESLARAYAEIEDRYMPGGPPMSPVYDSFASQYVLSSAPHGITDETPYSVLARLTVGDPSRARLHALAQTLADSRLELYRVKTARGLVAELEPLRGGSAIRVELAGPFLRAGDRALMRVLRFGEKWFIADSPYLLTASEQDWLEHFDRVVAAYRPGGARPLSASEMSKLTKKEQARRREKQKQQAKQHEPEAILARYLKRGPTERFWFEYIMDAYAGERRGIVFLAGVPDRPESLPHSAESERRAEALDPMSALRAALIRIATQNLLLRDATDELRSLCQTIGVADEPLGPNDELLLRAYATLGARSREGLTALEHFEREEAAELGFEMRSALAALKNGWFSVFRIDRLHLDKGLDVFDVLKQKELHIKERSITRQAANGDVLLGWLCEEDGTLTFEGGVGYVRSFIAQPILELAARLRSSLPSLEDKGWKARAAALPIPLLAGLISTRARGGLPTLSNTSGDKLEFVTAHYHALDPERVLASLESAFAPDGEGAYVWIDATDTVLARFELAGKSLRVRVISRERLEGARARLEALLGDAVKRGLDGHEDVKRAVEERLRRTRGTGTRGKPVELPKEALTEFHDIVLAKIRATLDEPIPQFKNKTLRQLARGKASRADAVSWLREQERILKHNPQLAGIDMRPVWQELTLSYQGLETDPPP